MFNISKLEILDLNKQSFSYAKSCLLNHLYYTRIFLCFNDLEYVYYILTIVNGIYY